MKEYKICRQYEDSDEIKVTESLRLEAPAEFAFELIRTNGFLCGVEDGEDSHGRAKLRLLPPLEVVERAFSISESFLKVAKDKGYLFILPSLAEVDKKEETEKSKDSA